MEDIQGLANLGELKEWVIWKMEGIARNKGAKGTEVRKEIEKMWAKWEDKGLIASCPTAPLPKLASVLCISALAKGEYNEVKADWERRGKHRWGKRTMEQKRVKAEITTAVCNLMSLAGRLKAEKEKDKKRL